MRTYKMSSVLEHSSEHFNKKEKPTRQQGMKAYQRLLKVASRYWFIFLIGVLGTATGSVIDALMAWYVKPIVNKGFIARDLLFIHWLPFAIVGIFLLRGVAAFISSYFITRVGRSVVMDFRQRIFDHLLKLPASYYDHQTSGKLISTIIYNVEQLAEASTDALVTMIRESVLVVGMLVVMFSISWRLSLIFLIGVPIIAVVVRLTAMRLRKLSRFVQESMGEVTHVAQETIEGYRVIRTFGGENYERNKFHKATRRNRGREMKIIVTNALGSSSVQVITSIPIAITLFLATSPSMGITAGSFASMIVAMLALIRPLRRLTKVNSKVQKGVAGAQSIFALLDHTPEKDTGTTPIDRATGKIDFQHVAFSYQQSDRVVLNEINFSVQPGQTVALVGRSGAGKSTIASLLPRFYDVTSGKIQIDGVNIHDYCLADLRNQFAFVSQNVTLFNDTIAANIAYGCLDEATEDAIIRAAEAAHAMEFIRELPNGLNSYVGENGVLLSGGQRQRIAIARALLKDAPILILDEATSALDTESERHIQAALEGLMRDRTTLVIAHRLSTIENADHIVVLRDGCVMEQGTHRELLSNDGPYARLHAMQFNEPATSETVDQTSEVME